MLLVKENLDGRDHLFTAHFPDEFRRESGFSWRTREDVSEFWQARENALRTIKNHFGYKISKELRKAPCVFLGKDKIISADGGNFSDHPYPSDINGVLIFGNLALDRARVSSGFGEVLIRIMPDLDKGKTDKLWTLLRLPDDLGYSVEQNEVVLNNSINIIALQNPTGMEYPNETTKVRVIDPNKQKNSYDLRGHVDGGFMVILSPDLKETMGENYCNGLIIAESVHA
jgi:hypothetical protein